MINKSTLYDGKEFRHDDRVVIFQRAWGGLSFSGFFLVVLGEERFFEESHYYVLCEAQEKTLPDLVEAARVVEATFKVQRWVGHLDVNLEEYLRISNSQAFQQGLRGLYVNDVPRIRDYIDVQLDLVYSTLQPLKRLHFFGQSMIPSELESLPTREVKYQDYPRAEALANVVSGMLKFGLEQVEPQHLCPEEEEWY